MPAGCSNSSCGRFSTNIKGTEIESKPKVLKGRRKERETKKEEVIELFDTLINM
jgi:hypothetical protein